MDREVFQRMQDLETRHWWFLARRQIIREVIHRYASTGQGARLLEAGCGTGGNLMMLSAFGHVDAFELDDQSRAAASVQGGMEVLPGSLPNEIPFDGITYDVIGLFDVLEHVEPDADALASLRSRLRPGGAIVLTVPAFPFLWSRHDETHHHFRRYTKTTLAKTADRAGLLVERSFYFNTALFPVAVLMRGLKKLVGSDVPDDEMPPAWLNTAMYRVFAAERHIVGRVPVPFGLSLGAVLRVST